LTARLAQVIFVFSDGSLYELYGSDIKQTSSLGSGGLQGALSYARECGAFEPTLKIYPEKK
jgi:hypothetical protein